MNNSKTGANETDEWKNIRHCRKIYSKQVIKILMCKNTGNATFLLSEDGEDYVLRYRALSDGYGEKEILEELNYYIFTEEQRKIAEPIRSDSGRSGEEVFWR